MDYPDLPYLYHRLASAYGWTPDQVDAVDVETLDWMVAIQGIEHEIQEDARKKQEREIKQRSMSRPRRRF